MFAPQPTPAAVRSRFPRLLALLAALVAVATAQEAPRRGPGFERWVRDTFFGGYQPGTGQRWDIPATANRDHGGIPVVTKVVKYGMAVDLGEARRQYEIDEPFLLIVGFWQQEGDVRRFVNIVAAEITPERWRQLWGQVTYADLLKLEDTINDTGPALTETRKRVIRMRNSPPYSTTVIQLNPRIDDHGLRQLQCSLRFADLFTHLAPGADSAVQPRPALFGVEFPGPASASPPRTP